MLARADERMSADDRCWQWAADL